MSDSADQRRNTEPQYSRFVAKVLNGNDDERNDAWRRLEQGCIRPTARKIAAKRFYAEDVRKDFVEQAPGHVYEKLAGYDAAKGAFEGWCYRVLQNLALDWGRRAKAKLEREQSFSDGQEQSIPAPSVEPIGETPQLNASHYAILTSMPPLRRVIVVCSAGIWMWITPSRWSEWLQKAGIHEPFPPLDVDLGNDPMQRVSALAELLGMKRDAVRQHWYRGKPKLKKLWKSLQE